MARLFGTICIIVIVFTFITEISLGEDDIEKALRLANDIAHKELFPNDYVECAIHLLYQVSVFVEAATKNYHKGQLKEVINQMNNAINEIDNCADYTLDTPFMFGGPEDIAQLEELLKKVKKEAFSKLRSQRLGPALSPA
ncbi:hypothetical protein A4A49_28321 [Nicotiana attenuata]|uniref:Pectinesterase inhibitor domain-containing protein n=1 Tax=Nicotiana attenuata TaxID=49451 RepID=A0A1J6IZT1_NICAT|nr:hypothetical protein A4A49_28321 [Nicotiana attenuata]